MSFAKRLKREVARISNNPLGRAVMSDRIFGGDELRKERREGVTREQMIQGSLRSEKEEGEAARRKKRRSERSAQARGVLTAANIGRRTLTPSG